MPASDAHDLPLNRSLLASELQGGASTRSSSLQPLIATESNVSADKRRTKAATAIQRIARGHLGRKRSTKQRQACTSAEIESAVAERREFAAHRIQMVAMQFIMRRRQQRRRKQRQRSKAPDTAQQTAMQTTIPQQSQSDAQVASSTPTPIASPTAPIVSPTAPIVYPTTHSDPTHVDTSHTTRPAGLQRPYLQSDHATNSQSFSPTYPVAEDHVTLSSNASPPETAGLPPPQTVLPSPPQPQPPGSSPIGPPGPRRSSFRQGLSTDALPSSFPAPPALPTPSSTAASTIGTSIPPSTSETADSGLLVEAAGSGAFSLLVVVLAQARGCTTLCQLSGPLAVMHAVMKECRSQTSSMPFESAPTPISPRPSESVLVRPPVESVPSEVDGWAAEGQDYPLPPPMSFAAMPGAAYSDSEVVPSIRAARHQYVLATNRVLTSLGEEEWKNGVGITGDIGSGRYSDPTSLRLSGGELKQALSAPDITALSATVGPSPTIPNVLGSEAEVRPTTAPDRTNRQEPPVPAAANVPSRSGSDSHSRDRVVTASGRSASASGGFKAPAPPPDLATKSSGASAPTSRTSTKNSVARDHRRQIHGAQPVSASLAGTTSSMGSTSASVEQSQDALFFQPQTQAGFLGDWVDQYGRPVTASVESQAVTGMYARAPSGIAPPTRYRPVTPPGGPERPASVVDMMASPEQKREMMDALYSGVSGVAPNPTDQAPRRGRIRPATATVATSGPSAPSGKQRRGRMGRAEALRGAISTQRRSTTPPGGASSAGTGGKTKAAVGSRKVRQSYLPTPATSAEFIPPRSASPPNFRTGNQHALSAEEFDDGSDGFSPTGSRPSVRVMSRPNSPAPSTTASVAGSIRSGPVGVGPSARLSRPVSNAATSRGRLASAMANAIKRGRDLMKPPPARPSGPSTNNPNAPTSLPAGRGGPNRVGGGVTPPPPPPGVSANRFGRSTGGGTAQRGGPGGGGRGTQLARGDPNLVLYAGAGGAVVGPSSAHVSPTVPVGPGFQPSLYQQPRHQSPPSAYNVMDPNVAGSEAAAAMAAANAIHAVAAAQQWWGAQGVSTSSVRGSHTETR